MKYDGIHAQRILEKQLPDGSWGPFHSLPAQVRLSHGVTTEMALRRLQNLGFTLQDDCIHRAVAYLSACLCGEKCIPDPREKTHDWDDFTEMMLAAWIRRFDEKNPAANVIAQKWADILNAAFASGAYDHSAYCIAFDRAFSHPPRGGRFVDFVSFYPLSLTAGLLEKQAEQTFVWYVLHHEPGIYYVYERPVVWPPEVFASRQTLRWLSAVELLAMHPAAKQQLGFAAQWLENHRSPDGTWDLTQAAKDDISLPYSDSWRKKDTRIADCTARIQAVLSKIK